MAGVFMFPCRRQAVLRACALACCPRSLATSSLREEHVRSARVRVLARWLRFLFVCLCLSDTCVLRQASGGQSGRVEGPACVCARSHHLHCRPGTVHQARCCRGCDSAAWQRACLRPRAGNASAAAAAATSSGHAADRSTTTPSPQRGGSRRNGGIRCACLQRHHTGRAGIARPACSSSSSSSRKRRVDSCWPSSVRRGATGMVHTREGATIYRPGQRGSSVALAQPNARYARASDCACPTPLPSLHFPPLPLLAPPPRLTGAL